MDQDTLLQRLETLGYYTLPQPHSDSPGYTGLLVVLRQVPHGHEPQRVQIPLHERNGKTSTVNLHAEIGQPLSHVFGPGQIVIRSGQGREATFYSFGGNLESDALAGETVYSLRSAAPLLELVPDRETIGELLAEETEILFARAEAQLRLSMEELLDRLVRAGPEAVYLAVLQSLLVEDGDPAAGHFRQNDFLNMLTSEQRWYQGSDRWPLIPRDLITLIQAIGEG